MIDVSGLTKYYGARRALHGLTFHVAQGEIVGLVGKNGAGKSSVLNILCAQLLPSAGDARVNGFSVTADTFKVRQQIGFLPEIAPIYEDTTVAGFLTYLARLRGKPAQAVAQRVTEVMGRTGLSGYGRRRMGTLSRGYRQRVGIAQAIVHDPPVVLLDEPMAGLDPYQIIQMRDLIGSLKTSHTVLFSTHILSEVTRVCDRVILIDSGRVRAEGAEEALRASLGRGQRLRLLVRGAQQAVAQAVGGVAGVSDLRCVAEESGLVRVELNAEPETREALSRAIAQGGLGLLELRAEGHGLEELFVQLSEPKEAQAS
ncbi:MAG: ABC transporter ATP-binding protein [Candidatus Lambdaproteobacteria bacterium]|nr:ABC transporter ATP-binding protein [Candidatus Lambdaproteobacteria bacterium]